MALLRVGDEEFNVVVEGPSEAPVLTLCHPLGADLSIWDGQMAAFTHHFRVIRYDSRGHGASPAAAGPYTLAMLGGDTLAILDALGVKTTHLLGLSMGGMVGQWLLAHAPERIARAVLANTASRIGPAEVWNARIRAVRAHGMASFAEPTLSRWFTPSFRAANPDAMARIGAMIAALPAQGYAGCCAALRDMDLRETVRAIAAPVLVIVGRKDTATPPADGRTLARSIPGARLITLNAAHVSAIEDADAFATATIAFLSAPRQAPVNANPQRGTSNDRTAKKAVVKTRRPRK